MKAVWCLLMVLVILLVAWLIAAGEMALGRILLQRLGAVL